MSGMHLEAINIIKGLAFSHLQFQQEQAKLLSSGTFDLTQMFDEMDRQRQNKVTALDLLHFLSVHRIAASERECQYVIWAMGGSNGFLTKDNFFKQHNNKLHSASRALLPADQMMRNQGELHLADLFQKEIQYYRTIESLRQEFVNKYGYQFRALTKAIDTENKNCITFKMLTTFIHQAGDNIDFSLEQYEAVAKKVGAKQKEQMSYKQFLRAFAPFEPFNFPVYRKQNNFQKAMDYISEQVKKLKINMEDVGEQEEIKGIRGSRKSGYFYDKNYYNQLKQYKTTYFDPHKQIKRKTNSELVGPQYHDHFFAEYYAYLEDRNRTEHYFNKFGKKYLFNSTNSIDKSRDNSVDKPKDKSFSRTQSKY